MYSDAAKHNLKVGKWLTVLGKISKRIAFYLYDSSIEMSLSVVINSRKQIHLLKIKIFSWNAPKMYNATSSSYRMYLSPEPVFAELATFIEAVFVYTKYFKIVKSLTKNFSLCHLVSVCGSISGFNLF